MSIFSRLDSIAKDVQHSASQILVKVFGQAAVDNFESEVKTFFDEDVLTIFSDAIAAAQALNPTDSAAARAAAFKQIGEDLATKGVNLAEGVINFGIDMVVGLLKANTPVAPAAPATPVAPETPATPATS